MVAKRAWIPAKGTYSVAASNEPFNPTLGNLSFDARSPSKIDSYGAEEEENAISSAEMLEGNRFLQDYLNVASLANLAHVYQNQNGEWNARGDPTEIAMQVFVSRFNWNRRRHTVGDHPQWKQIAEFPFDSDVKKMSVIFEEQRTNERYVFTKGAVERIIVSCDSIYLHEASEPTQMTGDIHQDILHNMESLAAMGLRVLALASRTYTGQIDDINEINRNEIENKLTFRGLIGLYDPPRPESASSVRACHEAGIAVHMLTGDHPGTARAIAAEVEILPSRMDQISAEVADSMVMTASRFDMMSDEEIDALPVLPLVIARCAPSTKVRMIEALHRRKKFAAMVSPLRPLPMSLRNVLLTAADWRWCQ